MNVLQNSSPILTMRFINWLGFEECELESYEYMYQVSSELHRKKRQAVVIGIAETDQIINIQEDKSYYIPDGAILSDSLSLLIETKIGQNSYLNENQLEGHKLRFAIGQEIEENKIITWKEIGAFFHEQLLVFKETNDILTCFLLEQFEEFCAINCIGRPKNIDYFFLHFEKVSAQSMAKKIHSYIWQEAGFTDIRDADTKDGIGYKRGRKPKFATLSITRQRHFILHIGKKEQELGIQIQKEIDKVLGREFIRPDYEDVKYPHEAYIRLEWVEDFEQIRPFIHFAYEQR